jgi:pyruvate dehydrogenase E1 component alpha subunit
MAALWKLPLNLCIENNQDGMGTSTNRSSSNNQYYTMGNLIPGMKVPSPFFLLCTSAASPWKRFQ